MMRYWTNFAKTGNPNGEGLPEWRSYDPNNKEKMHFDIPSKMLPISPQQLERYKFLLTVGMESLSESSY
jgi:para-nitrobenzyl esterase